LTRRLLTFPDVVIVSGGFAHFKGHPDRVSVDAAVADEAQRRIAPAEIDERFETWLPTPRDRQRVERFECGTVRAISGSPQARRFAIVNGVDAIVTIGGDGNTKTVLELALAIGKPALPIAFTGGDSGRIWKRGRDAIASSLRVDPATISRLVSTPRTVADRDRLADDVARAAHEAAERRCLVLMPFGRGHDGFYARVLRPAIEAAGFVPRRLDKDEYAGNIPMLFQSSLERSHAVLVDVTGANPNVMYELGQVHAHSAERPAVLLRRRLTPQVSAALPFYLRHERLIAASDDAVGHRHLAREVVAYLASVDRRRHGPGARVHQPNDRSREA
jgi:hypothetical protein